MFGVIIAIIQVTTAFNNIFFYSVHNAIELYVIVTTTISVKHIKIFTENFRACTVLTAEAIPRDLQKEY